MPFKFVHPLHLAAQRPNAQVRLDLDLDLKLTVVLAMTLGDIHCYSRI